MKTMSCSTIRRIPNGIALSKTSLTKSARNSSPSNESKDEAKQRILFNRATMNDDRPVLHELPAVPELEALVTPTMVAPGITPDRGAGKKPKCFFALFKSFLAAPLMGFPSEPENVHNLLCSNLQFARVCGFIPKMKMNNIGTSTCRVFASWSNSTRS